MEKKILPKNAIFVSDSFSIENPTFYFVLKDNGKYKEVSFDEYLKTESNMDKQLLKQNYEKACNDYLRAFCEKHEFDFEDASWVGDDVGGIALVGDLDFSMTTIITDIDEDAPEKELWKWYDYCAETGEFNLDIPNFHSWLHGCPRTDAATIERLRSLKQKLIDLCNEENSKLKEKNDR